ncbi:MAG: quinolinate synthase NadA [Proteobacteria bacterium]|nr:quinolinate synthase NadA [Pseudomonadota bacterium]
MHELQMSVLNIEGEIVKLKQQKNAIILAHYYQESDIQDIADFIGDSLDLSKKAKNSNADVIIFAGVRFMAEVAKILNPKARVFIPDRNAGCSLEDSCQAQDLAKFKQQNPNHFVVSYINCSTQVKALSDIICTSTNAEKIIRSIPKEKPILFAPDRHLGAYLIKTIGREMTLWQGSCIVHERFSEKNLVKLKTQHTDAKVIAHPECPEALLKYADFIGSTSKLLEYSKTGKKFIVMTEHGIIHQMKKANPDAEFLTVPYLERDGVTCINCNNCEFMKMNTMEKIHNALKNEVNEIIIPEELRLQAKKSLDAMLAIS